jgi:UDP-glucose 4-epimerase
MRVLITGGAGFVGSHLSRRLLDEGHEVYIVDSFQHYLPSYGPTYLENVNYRFEHLLKDAEIEWASIHSREAVREFASRAEPECVLHLAALAIPGVALHQPEEAFTNIVDGTVHILEAVRHVPSVKRFVYVSSSMVYGDFAQKPMPETGTKEPKDVYGAMKLCAEILVKILCRQYGLEYTIVRPSAAYGPTDNNRRVLQIFIENVISGKPIVAKNAASTVLDFTYVTDLADGLRLAATVPQAAGEEFNLTRGQERSLAEALDVLRTMFPHIEVVADPETDDFRPSRGTLDISKARSLLGFDPRHSLEEGIGEYVRFMLEFNPSLHGGPSRSAIARPLIATSNEGAGERA